MVSSALAVLPAAGQLRNRRLADLESLLPRRLRVVQRVVHLERLVDRAPARRGPVVRRAARGVDGQRHVVLDQLVREIVVVVGDGAGEDHRRLRHGRRDLRPDRHAAAGAMARVEVLREGRDGAGQRVLDFLAEVEHGAHCLGLVVAGDEVVHVRRLEEPQRGEGGLRPAQVRADGALRDARGERSHLGACRVQMVPVQARPAKRSARSARQQSAAGVRGGAAAPHVRRGEAGRLARRRPRV